MNKMSFVYITFLVFSYNSIYGVSCINALSEIEDFKLNPLGDILYDLMQLQVESNAPIGETMKLLNSIDLELEHEYNGLVKDYSAISPYCLSGDKNINNALTDIKGKISVYEVELYSKRGNLERTKVEYEELLSHYETGVKEIDEDIITEDKNKQDFLIKSKEISEKLNTITQLVDIVTKLMGEGKDNKIFSFVQLENINEKIHKISTILLEAKDHANYSFITTVIKSQPSLKLDKVLVNKILRILQDLHDNTDKFYKAFITNETNRRDDFERLIKNRKIALEHLKESMEAHKTNKKILKNEIVNIEGLLISFKKQSDNYIIFQKGNNQRCKDYNNNYEKEKSLYLNEREMIDRLNSVLLNTSNEKK